MTQAILEHINVTVSNADATAKLFCTLFDWRVRWSGAALDNGYTVHVGGHVSYLAIYQHPEAKTIDALNYKTINHLNHLGIVVADLAKVEQRVKQQGFETFSHMNRNPGGACFYFLTQDKLEVEVVSYVQQSTSFLSRLGELSYLS